MHVSWQHSSPHQKARYPRGPSDTNARNGPPSQLLRAPRSSAEIGTATDRRCSTSWMREDASRSHRRPPSAPQIITITHEKEIRGYYREMIWRFETVVRWFAHYTWDGVCPDKTVPALSTFARPACRIKYHQQNPAGPPVKQQIDESICGSCPSEDVAFKPQESHEVRVAVSRSSAPP